MLTPGSVTYMTRTEARELIREMRRTLSALQERVMYPDGIRLQDEESLAEALNLLDGNTALLRAHLLGAPEW